MNTDPQRNVSCPSPDSDITIPHTERYAQAAVELDVATGRLWALIERIREGASISTQKEEKDVQHEPMAPLSLEQMLNDTPERMRAVAEQLDYIHKSLTEILRV